MGAHLQTYVYNIFSWEIEMASYGMQKSEPKPSYYRILDTGYKVTEK